MCMKTLENNSQEKETDFQLLFVAATFFVVHVHYGNEDKIKSQKLTQCRIEYNLIMD